MSMMPAQNFLLTCPMGMYVLSQNKTQAVFHAKIQVEVISIESPPRSSSGKGDSFRKSIDKGGGGGGGGGGSNGSDSAFSTPKKLPLEAL